MDVSVVQAKQAMRATVRERVRAMTRADRADASGRIVDALESTTAFAQARMVVGFWPLSDEPDVRRLLERALALGKRVCLPRVASERVDLVAVHDLGFAGKASGLGVWEPTAGKVVPSSEVDLVLAPGMAFDARGVRLGRGKGFFDRLLVDRTTEWMVCGVCFGVAMVDEVPRESHDALVDAVATERGVSPVFPESAGLWATGPVGR